MSGPSSAYIESMNVKQTMRLMKKEISEAQQMLALSQKQKNDRAACHYSWKVARLSKQLENFEFETYRSR